MNKRMILIDIFIRSWKGLGLLLALMLMITSAASASGPADSSQLDIKKVEAYFQSQLTANNFKGIGVAIVHDDQLVYAGGFGNAAENQPFTAQTPFPIGSASKGFLALSVLQLVEAGQVELDAPIQKYLPWWQVADPKLSAEITVRDLLNQVSGLAAGPGLYDDSGSSYRLPADTSVEDAVRDMRSARVKEPRGSRFMYFDGNYWTLAVLVEKISGQTYTGYLKEHVLQPLGMQATTTTAEVVPGLALGNLAFFGYFLPYRENISQKYLVGCCGVITTAEDLANYMIAQLNSGKYGDIRLLSSPENFALMHAPRMDVGDFMGKRYGMGWWIEEEDGLKRIESPGTWMSYTTDMVLLPEYDYGIAIFYNEGCFSPSAIGIPGILSGALRLITGQEPEPAMTYPQFGWILMGLALLTLIPAGWSLARLPHWARKAQAFPAWRKALDISVPLVLAALLTFGIPYLFAVAALKTWDQRTVLLWMTDIDAWLLLLSLLLAINAIGRVVILMRQAVGKTERELVENIPAKAV